MQNMSRRVALILAGGLAAAPMARAASGGQPVSVPYSGSLLDSNDLPVTAAGLSATFRVFSASAAQAGETPEWESTCVVDVRAGRFATLLGAGACAGTSTLDSADLPPNQVRFLEISVGGMTLAPRLPVSSVATASVAAVAIEAERLGGRPASEYALKTDIVSNLTASAPLQVGGTAVAPSISLPAATATSNGYLSGADWSRFDAKVSSITTTGPLQLGGTATAPTLSIPVATAASNGYLSGADWSSFDAKVSSISASGPLQLGGTATAPALSMPAATASANGYLTSADWSRFDTAARGLSGAIKVGASTATCDASTAGSLRFNAAAGRFEGCTGTAWTTMATQLGLSADSPGASCSALRSGGVGTDGVYWIDPDGVGGTAAYQVWCDMTVDGGGWTLVMRMANDNLFTYDSAYWTDGSLLNETSVDATSNSNAKYRSFLNLSGTTLRGCKGTPSTSNCIAYTFGAARTPQSLFQGGVIGASFSRSTFTNLFGDDGGQPNCNQNGINRNDLGTYARVRFGHIGNNEGDCATSDAAWGWGGYGASGGTKCGAGLASWQLGSLCVQGSLWIR